MFRHAVHITGRWDTPIQLSPVLQTPWTTLTLRRWQLSPILYANVQHFTIGLDMLCRVACRDETSRETLKCLQNVKHLTLCLNGFEVPCGAFENPVAKDLWSILYCGFDISIAPTGLAMRHWMSYIKLFSQLREVHIQRQPISIHALVKNQDFLMLGRRRAPFALGPVTEWEGQIRTGDCVDRVMMEPGLLLTRFRLEQANDLLQRLDAIFLEDIRTLISLEDKELAAEDKSRWTPYKDRLPIVDGCFAG